MLDPNFSESSRALLKTIRQIASSLSMLAERVRKLEIKRVAAGGGTGHTIADEGVPLASEPVLNFIGANVTVTDNAGVSTDVTIAGGIPGAHASSHQDTGGDEIDVTGLSGLLADEQNPVNHAADHENGGGDEIDVTGLSGLLADAQTPIAHTHDDRYYTETELAVSAAGGQVHWDNVTNKPSFGVNTLFYHSDASGIGGYLDLLPTPADDPEEDDTVTITNGDGETLINGYITDELGTTLIEGGVWEFHLFSYVSLAAGASSLVVRVYKRASGGAETELFNITTGEINDVAVTEYEVTSVQPDFIVLSDDHLLIKIFGLTTSGAPITIHFVYEGTTNYSHLHIPFVLATTPANPPHASTHENGGSDEISVAGLSGTLADPQPTTRQFIFNYAGDLEVGSGAFRLYNHIGSTITITAVYIAVNTAPTGSGVTIDIHKNGTTIFTTQGNRPTIADGANTGSTSTIDVPSWADASYLTMDIDAIGSTTPGSNLTVTVVGVG